MGKLTQIALAVLAALIAGSGVWFGVEQRGAKKATAKIEARNEEAIANADTAGTRSRDPHSRGLRDPYAGHD